jgi:hypothetical protein
VKYLNMMTVAAVAAVTFVAAPAQASGDFVRAACEVKPSGLLKCAVAFPEADLHRLDVTYVRDGEVQYDTTVAKGSRHETGVTNADSLRLARGLRLTCAQLDSRMECVASGTRDFAVRFYVIRDGEFYNWGGGGA